MDYRRYQSTLSAMFWPTDVLPALPAEAVAAVPQTGGSFGSADFLRFDCSQLVVEWTGLLVNPRLLPSWHIHQVVRSFSFTVGILMHTFTKHSQKEDILLFQHSNH
jgi:hypothetical protein